MAFVIISKNACSFLKKVAIFNQEGKWPDYPDVVQVHNKIGYDPMKSEYLMSFEQIRKLERKQKKAVYKFAVWRDPINRIVSTYRMFCLEREYRPYILNLALYTDSSFERFMQFVRFENNKSNPFYMDEHLRAQADYYSLADVDEIVHIDRDIQEYYNPLFFSKIIRIFK